MTKKAFTIIEVLLSMAFLALMILMIGYTTLRIINIYNKGVSIKDVNRIADLIISDFQDTMANGGSIRCAIKYDRRSNMSALDTDLATCAQLLRPNQSSNINGGAICTGRYSYIWNYGQVFQKLSTLNQSDRNSLEADMFRYKDGPGRYKLVRLVKVRDDSARYCPELGYNTSSLSWSDPTPKIYNNNPNDLSEKSEITELIESGDRELALHSMLVVNGAQDELTGQSLYEIEFILGTFREGLLETQNAKCKNLAQGNTGIIRPDGSMDNTQKVDNNDLSYCAINKFNFAARAVKGKGKW